MRHPGLEVQQTGGNRVVEKLPDGSTAVFDTATNTIHSLNAGAAAAFDACREKTAVAQLMRSMSQALGVPVSEEIALTAIAELERAGLVACSGAALGDSRRSILKALGTAAGVGVPVVLSLTGAEQRLYAAVAGSGTTTTTTTTTTTAAPPSIASVAPVTLCRLPGPYPYTGIQINGQNTHFSGSSVVTFSVGAVSVAYLTVSNVAAIDATHLTLDVLVAAFTAPAPPDEQVTVTVTTGSETVARTNAFTVSASMSCLTSQPTIVTERP
jgi:hypothetical protein